MSMNTVRDLLVEQLNELYAAERHHMMTVPRLVQATTDTRLADMLRAHADGVPIDPGQEQIRIDIVINENLPPGG